MNTLEYAISSGAWSLGGLIVGYLLGRIQRTVEHIEHSEDTDDHA